VRVYQEIGLESPKMTLRSRASSNTARPCSACHW